LRNRHPEAAAFEVDEDLIYDTPYVNGEERAEELMQEMTTKYFDDKDHQTKSQQSSQQAKMVHDVCKSDRVHESDDYRKAIASAAYKLMMTQASAAYK
jgi:hypothetical protein